MGEKIEKLEKLSKVMKIQLIKIRGCTRLQNTWSVVLKTVKIIKNKESLKNSQFGGNLGDMMVKCVCSGWDQRTISLCSLVVTNLSRVCILTSYLWDINNRETGYGVYGNSLYYLCNIFVNLKLFLKLIFQKICGIQPNKF